MSSNIEYLMSLHEQNNILIERLMRSNEEIQRAIINVNNSAQIHTQQQQVTRRNARYENDIRNALYRVMRPRQPMRINNQFLEPVSVFPTSQQIEIATRRTRYGDITRPVNTTCPISLDAFTDEDNVVMIRHCGHIFKTNEFNSWFGAHCRCPVCRYDIREYTNTTEPGSASANTPAHVVNITDASGSISVTNNNTITRSTGNILNSILNNTEINQNDLYNMLNLLVDSSSNYVSLHFDITD